MTGATAASTAAAKMNGGKMLCRIALDDPGTVATMTACAKAVDELAAHGLIAMLEPFMSSRVNGKVRNDLSPDAVIKSVHIGQGLGSTSAYTWMKLPVVDEMDRVMESTTLPTLLLGGDPPDPDEAFASWEKALGLPSVRGLIVGRTLLYPADDDVELRGRRPPSRWCADERQGKHAQQALHPGAQRRTAVHRRRHAGVGGLDRVLLAGTRTRRRRRAPSSHTGDTEVMILPLAGGGTVECDGETFELAPRASVFDGPSDMVYVGIDQELP